MFVRGKQGHKRQWKGYLIIDTERKRDVGRCYSAGFEDGGAKEGKWPLETRNGMETDSLLDSTGVIALTYRTAREYICVVSNSLW